VQTHSEKKKPAKYWNYDYDLRIKRIETTIYFFGCHFWEGPTPTFECQTNMVSWFVSLQQLLNKNSCMASAVLWTMELPLVNLQSCLSSFRQIKCRYMSQKKKISHKIISVTTNHWGCL
jgi:UDP-N-acetylmuramyl pentapeptide synthase